MHIQETTFALFSSMEDEIRDGLEQLVTEPNTIKKAELIKKIKRNDDVQFYWCIISADFEIDDTETHAILLEMIIELYVTIRGFSFASA